MESVASAGIAMEQMVEDFGVPLVMFDGHVAVYCGCCQLAVYDFIQYLNHVHTRRHRQRSAVIMRRVMRREERRRLRRAALLEAMQ